MKGRQLTLLHRQHCNGTPTKGWTVAAWHWTGSLTWRGLITWEPRHEGRLGAYFMRTYRGRGFNFCCGLHLPLVGALSMQTQPNMWRPPDTHNRRSYLEA